ncbi:unnamed protein product [Sympodiomycopsis kandeliae]
MRIAIAIVPFLVVVSLLLSSSVVGRIPDQQDRQLDTTPHPYRWRSFLPSKQPNLVAAQSHSPRVRPVPVQPVQPVVEVQQDHYDYDEDNDDDDSNPEEEERQIRAYLRYKTRKEGKKVLQTAKQAGQAGQAIVNDTRSTAPSRHSVNQAIVSLLKLIPTTVRFGWLSVKLGSRYGLHLVRLTWSTLVYVSSLTWTTAQTVWSTTIYITHQILRPLRVIFAPVIYIYLGAKLVLLDVPLHYSRMFLRETYPIYVFTGAALSLGTLIGVACSLVLWIGQHVFSNSSELEHVVMSWQGGGKPTSQQTKKGKARVTTDDKDGDGHLPDYLVGLGKQWKPLAKQQLKRRHSNGSGTIPADEDQLMPPVDDYFSLGMNNRPLVSSPPSSSSSSSSPNGREPSLIDSILSPPTHTLVQRRHPTSTPERYSYDTGSTTSSGSTSVNRFRGHGPVGATGRKSSRHRRDPQRERDREGDTED